MPDANITSLYRKLFFIRFSLLKRSIVFRTQKAKQIVIYSDSQMSATEK